VFDFNEENTKLIKKILAKYPAGYKKSAVLPLLDLAQRQNSGWVPLVAMDKIADILKIPPMAVYEVATFYSMIKREKLGKYNLEVCATTPCMIRGAYELIDKIKQKLGIGVGETTQDKMFTCSEVECLGACVNAPMIQIGDYFYEDLTPETLEKLIDDLAAGRPITPGPQNGNQKSCEGPMGRTTLLEPPMGPFCRDL